VKRIRDENLDGSVKGERRILEGGGCGWVGGGARGGRGLNVISSLQ
jgi:hypothetical protein